MNVTPKTRALRKYEAEAHVVHSADGDPSMDFFSPFGPMIARMRLPGRLVADINAVADTGPARDRSSELYVPPEIAFAGGEARSPARLSV